MASLIGQNSTAGFGQDRAPVRGVGLGGFEGRAQPDRHPDRSAAGDGPAKVPGQRREPAVVRDRGGAAAGPRQPQQAGPIVVEGGAQRLLAEHVAARPQRRRHQRDVHRDRRGHVDGVDLGEQRREVSGAAAGLVGPGDRRRALPVAAPYAGHLLAGLREGRERAVPHDRAAAGHPPPEPGLGHGAMASLRVRGGGPANLDGWPAGASTLLADSRLMAAGSSSSG
jgi:hypothetical protein